MRIWIQVRFIFLKNKIGRCSFIHDKKPVKLIDDESIAFFTSENIEMVNFKESRLDIFKKICTKKEEEL
jgi:hypothetical protein